MSRKKWLCVSAGVVCAAALYAADGNMIGQMTQNEGITAVPAPKSVAIDGNLGEWDMSGEIWSFADYEVRDQFSVKTAAMWDEEALYLSFRWKDPMPLNSTANPDFDASHGWRADAVECRIQAGKCPLWLTSWCFEGRPCAMIQWWKSPDSANDLETKLYKGTKGVAAIGDGIESCYKMMPSKDGFVHEMKIPWSVMRKESAGKVGDVIKLGLQFKWGDVTGRGWPAHDYTDNVAKGTTERLFFWRAKKAWGEVTLAGESVKEKRKYVFSVTKPKGTIPVRAEVPADATTFTIVIDDKDGKRVRNLAGGFKIENYKVAEADGKATVEVMWDGLDELGNLVREGEYDVRGLVHNGLVSKYVMSFYNPGTPPWSTPDGKGAWGSDHSRTEYVVRSGDNMILACGFVEGGYGIWAVGKDGKKVWSERRGVQKLAANDKYVFSVPNDWYTKEETLYRYNAKDGTYAPFVAEDGQKREMDYPIRKIAGVEKLKSLFVEENKKKPHVGLPANPTILALVAGPESVLIGLCEGKLVEADQETGSKIAEYNFDYDWVRLEKVASVNDGLFDRFFAPLAYDGKEIYFYRKGVLTVRDAKSGNERTIATGESVGKPVSIALDAAKNIYVADAGADVQVKKFSQDGKLLAKYGNKGGRARTGKFVQEAMLDISSADVDADGNVWVVEFTDFPRRVSVWNNDGAYKKDFIGNTGYSGVGCFLHDSEPGRFFCGPNEMSFDEKTYTSKMERVLINPEPDSNTLSMPTGANEFGHIFYSSASGKKREYYFRSGQIFMNDAGKWKPVSAVITLGAMQGLLTGGYRRIATKLPYGEFEGMNPYDILVWNDANGDGIINRNECEVIESSHKCVIGDKHTGFRARKLRTGWGSRIDPENMAFYMSEQGAGSNGTRWCFKPESFAANGAPKYTLNSRVKIGDYPIVESTDMTPVPGEDTIIAFTKIGDKKVMTGLGKKGGVKWQYGNPYDSVHGSHQAVMPTPGLLIGPLKVTGFVRDCGDAKNVFMIRGNLGSDFYLTSDGLYVDSMFRDERLPRQVLPKSEEALRGMPFNMFSMGGEPFNGWIGRQDDGKVRMLCGFAGQASSLVTIDGLEKIRRFTAQSVKLDAVTLAKADADNLSRASESKVKPYKIAKAADKIDWKKIPAMQLEREGLPSKGTCKLAYNDTTLFARFEVKDDSPWMNGGKIKSQMFKTGDCVDLQLSATGNKSREVKEGDLRVVASPFGDGNCAMLMRKVCSKATPEEAVKYQSPVRMFMMAQVKELNAPVVTKTKKSYTVDLELAWSDLGITPKAGLKLCGDAGMILSDAAGQYNTARVYYSNKQTNLVNDLPGEADLYPNMWCEMELGE